MVHKPDFSNFPTLPTDPAVVQQAQQLWTGYERALHQEIEYWWTPATDREVQADIAAFYRQFQQQTLISSLSLPAPTKPMTSRGRNYVLAPQGGTHRPVGAPQHVHAPDRVARRERRTKQDQIVQRLATTDD